MIGQTSFGPLRGLRLDDDEGVLPAWPMAPEPEPEHPVPSLDLGTLDLALIDLELLAERGDLEDEIRP